MSSRCPKIKHKVSITFVLVCRGRSLGFKFQVQRRSQPPSLPPILQRLLPGELESLRTSCLSLMSFGRV